MTEVAELERTERTVADLESLIRSIIGKKVLLDSKSARDQVLGRFRGINEGRLLIDTGAAILPINLYSDDVPNLFFSYTSDCPEYRGKPRSKYSQSDLRDSRARDLILELSLPHHADHVKKLKCY